MKVSTSAIHFQEIFKKKENTKKEVLANFNRLVEFNKDVLDKRYDEISEMKKKIKKGISFGLFCV